MPWFEFFWYDENIVHLAEHEVTPDEGKRMIPIESCGPMPPEVKARWEKSLAAVDLQSVTDRFAIVESAAAEDNFSGFLRRCIHQSGKTMSLLVGEANVDRDRLSSFLRGEGLLDSAEIDRLLAALTIELTPSSSPQA